MPRRSLSVMVLFALVASSFLLTTDAGAKRKKPKACPAGTFADVAADAPVLKLTDANTAEAPLVHPFALEADFDEGAQGEAPTAYVNVQIDSAAPTTGLYATFEFPDRRDYDLWALWDDGSEAASSHGFNPLIEAKTPGFDVSNTGGNHAGESHANSENLVGVTTNDCGSYTLRMSNYFGEGGDFEVKIWTGEGTTEPRAPGEVTPP
jgi:hypothetical protein